MQIHAHQCMAILGLIIQIQSNLDYSNLGNLKSRMYTFFSHLLKCIWGIKFENDTI